VRGTTFDSVTGQPEIWGSQGVTGLRRLGTGEVCVTLDPALGIDLTKTAIVGTVNLDVDSPVFMHASDSLYCNKGEVHVLITEAGIDNAVLTDYRKIDWPFSIIVP
jgi:hypothetical protein